MQGHCSTLSLCTQLFYCIFVEENYRYLQKQQCINLFVDSNKAEFIECPSTSNVQ